MKVFKFGGASINSIERIHNVADILKKYEGEKLLVVISAIGKTTNSLEKVVDAFFSGNKNEALLLFEQIKADHLTTLKQLLISGLKEATDNLNNFFTEIEWLLHDKPVQDYNYYYDQIVCVGELLSTSMISSFLKSQNIMNTWIDVRDVFRTDDNFRDANVDMFITPKKVSEFIEPFFKTGDLMITQGFIGSTDENESTTLGREGSDYTAALFANMLDAESLTIWKDVEGVMNADPKEFNDAIFIKELNFEEVIEMAYYGAQVIHPKTIKPLQNKNIPLYVKCFLKYDASGTLISNKAVHNLPPVIVVKQDQLLMKLSSKDFSFVGEKPVSRLYEIFAEVRIRPNLMQNGAISLLVCLDEIPEKIEKLSFLASDLFDVHIDKGLTLLTIRHYNSETIVKLTAGKDLVLEQKTNQTIQLLMR
ncbi:aspartate kinase [soil metagenome]